MNTFLKKVLLLSVILFFTALFCEYLARRVPNPYKMKEEWMQHNSSKLEIMILGSSHAFYGVNPAFLDRPSFNLAYVSQGLEYDDYLLNRYLSNTPKLRFVFLSISSFSLFENLEEHTEWFRIINYQLYMGAKNYNVFSKYNYEMSHFWGATEKIKAYYLKRENTVVCSDLGYGTDYLLKSKNLKSWDNGEERVKECIYKDWKYLSQNKQHLIHMANLCEKAGVQLVLFTTPARPSYYNNLYQKQMDCMYQVIQAIMCDHKNVVYKNFLKDSSFVADDFYDQDHLTEIGAEKLTRILKNCIE